jgi:3-oxoacyl-[acyl-carrier-protein] synthase II
MSRSVADVLAVTGVGCISGLGLGVDAFERALFDGESAIAPVTAFDTRRARSHVAGQILDFDPAAFIPAGKLRRIDRVGRLAVASCRLALEHAGLASSTGPPTAAAPAAPVANADRVGVAIGTATAGVHSLVDYLDRLVSQGPTGASALDFSNTVGNAAASLCGIEFGLRGPNVTLSYKEASALSAVTYAAMALDAGRADAMVTGAVDDFEALFFAAHDQFGVLARDAGAGEASRPFDRRRNGFVLGNGAFLLVLERAEAAAARGAARLGSVAGLAATASPCRLNEWPSNPAQMIRCMRDALAEAGVAPRDVSVVFASANSTRQLDQVEAEALGEVFGAAGVPVVALKGALGESSAAGAASLVAALLCLKRGAIPPTVGFEEAEADCPVDIGTRARPLMPRPAHAALVNSFASGGANFSAVVRA